MSSAFWSDLTQDLNDPGFEQQYMTESRRIAAVDALRSPCSVPSRYAKKNSINQQPCCTCRLDEGKACCKCGQSDLKEEPDEQRG